MRITESQLRKIVREEVEMLGEGTDPRENPLFHLYSARDALVARLERERGGRHYRPGDPLDAALTRLDKLIADYEAREGAGGEDPELEALTGSDKKSLEAAIEKALDRMNPPGDNGSEARAAKKLKMAMDSGNTKKMEDAITSVYRDFGHMPGALGRAVSAMARVIGLGDDED
jgi:hypothetical protein